MKFAIAGIFAFIGQLTFVPASSLVLALAFVIFFDFVTGCRKARKKGIATTSKGFRKTIDKFISYGSAVAISCVLCFVAQYTGGEAAKIISGFLNNGVVCLCIYIEVVSICENSIEINRNSSLSVYFFTPLHKFLTLQLKRNPVIQASEGLNEQIK
jgi:predicted neutral ceramidase superfamily lipid hydrolase